MRIGGAKTKSKNKVQILLGEDIYLYGPFVPFTSVFRLALLLFFTGKTISIRELQNTSPG